MTRKLDAGEIHCTRVRKRLDQLPTETLRERQVFSPPSLVSMLSEHRDLGAGWRKPNPVPLAVTTENDQPPQPNTLDHRWRMERNRAGVGPIRLQDMRHFYASGLIAAGCTSSPSPSNGPLCRASATTPPNTYRHLWPNVENRTRSATGGLLEQTAGAASTDSMRTSEKS